MADELWSIRPRVNPAPRTKPSVKLPVLVAELRELISAYQEVDLEALSDVNSEARLIGESGASRASQILRWLPAEVRVQLADDDVIWLTDIQERLPREYMNVSAEEAREVLTRVFEILDRISELLKQADP